MKKKKDEIVDIDELSARYIRIQACEKAKGYGARTATNHFQLALLYEGTGRFRRIGNGMKFRIPYWSDFSEAAIAARELEIQQQ